MNEIENTQEQNKQEHGNSQFSFSGLFAITAAFALWLFLLSDFRSEPMAIAFFWTLAVVAGILSHLLYVYLIPWRGTVIASLVVVPLLVFIAISLLLGASVEVIVDVLLLPADMFAHERWSARLRFSIPLFTCMAVLSVAHPVKPSLSSAIISAIGVSLWYGMAILIAANAG